jgi:hypothetical protein
MSRITPSLKKKCWNEQHDSQHGPCYVCGFIIASTNFKACRLVSTKNGGSLNVDNIVPVCGMCNVAIGQSNVTNFPDTTSCKFEHAKGTGIPMYIISIDNGSYLVQCKGPLCSKIVKIAYGRHEITVPMSDVIAVAKHIKYRNPTPIILGDIEICTGEYNICIKFHNGDEIYGTIDDALLDILCHISLAPPYDIMWDGSSFCN